MIAPNNAVEIRAVMKVGRRGEEERRRGRRKGRIWQLAGCTVGEQGAGGRGREEVE
jgi:hypothetical protein